MIRPDGTVVCGDYMDVASIQGAMRSGRLAAEAIQASMQPA
jgi:predicted NAD/FAD-dependent oxidoreductase